MQQSFFEFEYVLHVQGKELRGRMTVRTINRNRAEVMLERTILAKFEAIGIEISEGGFWVEMVKLVGNPLDELMGIR